jgi:hypothetical protein
MQNSVLTPSRWHPTEHWHIHELSTDLVAVERELLDLMGLRRQANAINKFSCSGM